MRHDAKNDSANREKLAIWARARAIAARKPSVDVHCYKVPGKRFCQSCMSMQPRDKAPMVAGRACATCRAKP
jgi:hypothetical protein